MLHVIEAVFSQGVLKPLPRGVIGGIVVATIRGALEARQMGHRGFGRVGRAAGLALLAAAPALAADGPSAEPKNEIVVFGGASILDASRSQDATVGIPGWIGDRWPGFPDVQVRTETSLGGSALFGARYSRYVKRRLAVEADLAVAPTHDLQAGGAVCLDGRCFGGPLGGRAPAGETSTSATSAPAASPPGTTAPASPTTSPAAT
jgi:hypothetical protein